MKAVDLSIAFEAAQVPDDARAQRIVCTVLGTLRDFLRANVTEGRGIGGVIFRALYPDTAKGLKDVIRLLDEYLAANCG